MFSLDSLDFKFFLRELVSSSSCKLSSKEFLFSKSLLDGISKLLNVWIFSVGVFGSCSGSKVDFNNSSSFGNFKLLLLV